MGWTAFQQQELYKYEQKIAVGDLFQYIIKLF
jgi:hypothetical protein